MAHNLPKFIAIKKENTLFPEYAYSATETSKVRCGEENVYNSNTKIEVETATIGSKFVHLRFCHTNKYWARRGPSIGTRWIFAYSEKEEDTSKLTCTLFEPTISNDGFLYLTHVQSGGHVRLYVNSFSPESYRFYVDDTNDADGFPFVDWDTLVILPQHVAFKGDNGKFLKDINKDYHEYLQFSSDDGNDGNSSYEIQMQQDGYVRIISDHYKKFWRRSPNWIWSDANKLPSHDPDTFFWPVKVNDNTIALRNKGNNNFCKRLTIEGKTDCLNAASTSITPESKLIVEELVLERNIYDVRYRMEDARIFDETPFLAGIGTAVNESSEQSSLTVRVSYQNSHSYSFTSSLSIMAGVKTSITTGFAKIAEGKIEISAEITTSFEWNRETTETETLEGAYIISVPPKSRARVNFVATKGKCNVPFSYTQRDKRSSDGSFVASQHTDGVYAGVNYYSFHFEQPAVEPLIVFEEDI